MNQSKIKTDHEWVVEVEWDDVDWIVEGDWDGYEPWAKHIYVNQGEREAADNSQDMMPLLKERLAESILAAAVEIVEERERVDAEAAKIDMTYDSWRDHGSLCGQRW